MPNQGVAAGTLTRMDDARDVPPLMGSSAAEPEMPEFALSAQRSAPFGQSVFAVALAPGTPNDPTATDGR